MVGVLVEFESWRNRKKRVEIAENEDIDDVGNEDSVCVCTHYINEKCYVSIAIL